MIMFRGLTILALIALVPLVAGQAYTGPALRNSSTLPLSGYSVTINPWTNHYQFSPISVPVNTSISFIWTNDDHGVFLLNNDQCPENFTNGVYGMEELYPVTSQTGGTSNYTTVLTQPGIYYFACQEGVHCLQGQRLQVSVIDYQQGIPGSVTALGPSPQTSTDPNNVHTVPTNTTTTTG